MLRVGSVFPGMPRRVAGVKKVLRSLVQGDSRIASTVTMTFGGSPDGKNGAGSLHTIGWGQACQALVSRWTLFVNYRLPCFRTAMARGFPPRRE